MRRGIGAVPSVMCIPGGCLSAVAATSAGSEVIERRVAIAGRIHMGVAFAATMLRTSLVRSTTWFRS